MLHLDRDAVPLGIGQQLLAGEQVPLAPWRDHLDVRLERVVAELKADLVVALAGGTVAHRVGAGGARDLDLPLGDQRPRDRGAEQVFALVEGVGAEHGEDEIANELLAQVVDEDVLRLDTELQRLGTRRLEFLTLAEVGGEGHYLALVGVLQPLEDDRGVETARVGEHGFLDCAHEVCSISFCLMIDSPRHSSAAKRFQWVPLAA